MDNISVLIYIWLQFLTREVKIHVFHLYHFAWYTRSIQNTTKSETHFISSFLLFKDLLVSLNLSLTLALTQALTLEPGNIYLEGSGNYPLFITV